MFERQNLCFLKKLTHVNSGEDIDPQFFIQTTYVESMHLTGPKLLLTLKDHAHYLSQHLQIKEMDEFSASIADDWREEGENIAENFVVLSARKMPQDFLRISAMAKPLYKLKQIADKTKIFSMRGISDIIAFFLNGLTLDLASTFAIVENYHLLAGERPTTLLRQIAQEQGADVWIARGKLHLQRFAEAFAKGTSHKFEYNRMDCGNPILDYTVPSGQLKLQESKVRIFTGWDPVKGRVQTSTSNPLFSGVKSLPKQINGNPNPYTLGNAVVAAKPAVSWTTLGNLSVQPGQTVSLLWHEADPQNPLNESMPEKVVVQRVGHWHQGQKFYTRIEGAVPFESNQVLF